MGTDYEMDPANINPLTYLADMNGDGSPSDSLEHYQVLRPALLLLQSTDRVAFDIALREVTHRLKIKTATVLADLASLTPPPTPTAAELVTAMKDERWLHPAQDYLDGTLYFGVPVGDNLFFVTSEHKAIAAQDLPAGVKLDHRGFDRCDFSKEGIQAYLAGKLDTRTPDLIQDLDAYFSRYVVFPGRDIPLVLSTWTLGTYVYRVFEYFPYLVLRSPQKRCGKSRVEDELSLVAFNASHRETRPTEASLFRGPSKNGGTLILDEIEMLGSQDQDTYGGILAVLNDGFQRGGEVTRIEKRGEKFIEVKYPTYAPRVLAGLKRMAETLEDRSITITMQRKRRDHNTDRFSPRRLRADTQALKDRCYGWALTYAIDAVALYEDGTFPELAALDDRARDLWEPLMTIADLADQEQLNAGKPTGYAARLKAVAAYLCQVREEGEDETANLVQALLAILSDHGTPEWDIQPKELFPLVQAKGFDWLRSTKGLSGLMQGLGIFRESVRHDGKIRRMYRLSIARLEDLRDRYGPSDGGD